MNNEPSYIAKIAEVGTLLHGTPPAEQSVILADLLAIFIAGHRPDIRATVLSEHYRLVDSLIPINERIMFGDGGWNEAKES